MTVLDWGGCAGLGLVWGWFLGSMEGTIFRPRRTLFFLSAATLVLAAQAWGFRGWPGLTCFGVCAGASLSLHAGWRRSLRRRRQPVNPPA